MTENEFWNLVNANRARDEWCGDSIESTWLEEQLSLLPIPELKSFETWMSIAHKRILESNRIFGAASLIGDCSDNGFEDFGGWIISMGKDAYYRVLADADALAEIGYGEDEDFTRHAYDVMKRATGSGDELIDLPVEGYEMEQPELTDPGPVPSTDDFGDDEIMAAAYPRIWLKRAEEDEEDDD